MDKASQGDVLITFLGAGSVDRARRYRSAHYDFGDGDIRTTRFFGLSLCKKLGVKRLVILGTSGSMWDVLPVEQHLSESDSEPVYRLMEAADTDQVDRDTLAPFEGALSESLGVPVSLDIIPYGTTSEQQHQIVSLMASHAERSTGVHIDVTHGLRHLPIVSLAAAQVMQSTLGKPIRGIHYGALDLTRDGKTPVVSLSGLLDIQQWLHAFQTFYATRDLGVFVPLMKDELDEAALSHLQMASFFERLNETGKSREQLRKLKATLDEQRPRSPMATLFLPELERSIGWTLEGSLGARQLALARVHLKNGDYLRATILAFEAWVSARVRWQGGSDTSYEARKEAAEWLAMDATFKTLRQIRNAVAHGTRPDTRTAQQAVSSPDRMTRALEECMSEIDRYMKKA